MAKEGGEYTRKEKKKKARERRRRIALRSATCRRHSPQSARTRPLMRHLALKRTKRPKKQPSNSPPIISEPIACNYSVFQFNYPYGFELPYFPTPAESRYARCAFYFLMLWQDCIRMGRMTSDIARRISVTPFVASGT